jgi:hypothetical protein
MIMMKPDAGDLQGTSPLSVSTGQMRTPEQRQMVTIQVSDETARALTRQAAAAGLSLEDYLRTLAQAPGAAAGDDFDAELDKVALPGPTLPADFSRADIYGEHD